MMDERDDENIRQLFAELRSHSAGSAPPFAHFRQQNVPVHDNRGLRLLVAAALVLLLGGGLSLLVPRLSRSSSRTGQQMTASVRTDRQSQTAMIEWQAPTDFLLQTPGRELVHSTPAFGESTFTTR